jgi:CSLREA domain-containing protein
VPLLNRGHAVNRSLFALLMLVFVIFGLQPFTLAAQEEITPEAVVTKTTMPTEEVTPAPTAEITDEPTLETTLEPTADVTVEPTAELTLEPTSEATAEPTLQPSAPPTFNLTQTTFDAHAGVLLEISLSVSDEAGIVRVVEDASATLGGVSVSTTAPTESSAPFNTSVSVTYLGPADFSGIDSFSLNAIDGAGETASVTISVNVVNVEATAEMTAVPENGVMAATTFTVNSNNDVNDGVCNTAHCSLREAINASNLSIGVKDTIRFRIGTGVQTIQPTSALPEITDPVIIDGTTQPGFAGKPIIELSGSTSDADNGLAITSGSTTVRGLVVNTFDVGIFISGGGNNIIEGNYIGTNVSGTEDAGFGSPGIHVWNSSSNRIGGTSVAARNIISGASENLVIESETGRQSSNNVIQGNYIGIDATGTKRIENSGRGIFIIGSTNNIIGGTVPGARNVVSGGEFGDGTAIGISINPETATGNVVQGNYIGLNAAGTSAIPNEGGIYIDDANNNLIGGTTPNARNVISGNVGSGVYLGNFSGIDPGGNPNVVQGNYIGTDVTGTISIPNRIGISIYNYNAAGGTVGGLTAGAGNVISGNTETGMSIYGNNIHIQGNYIGTNASGTAALPNNIGIVLGDGNNSTIGGNGAGNLIAYNTSIGITVDSDYLQNNRILGNRIFSNGSLGIDLGASGISSGVTPNDPLDADTGPNNFQNYPVLSSAAATNSAITINGTLNSEANKTYRVEFFSNDACDASGYGEGQNYLGFVNVTTNASGDASVNTRLTASGTIGKFITSTATDPDGNTSEFSACRQTYSTTPQNFTVNSNNDVNDGGCNAAHCSLREAINASNLSIGVKDTIRFRIGTGVQTIQPTTTLPEITDPVIIDGTTQPGFAGTPIIELRGVIVGSEADVLTITAGNSVVKGLVINTLDYPATALIVRGNGNNRIIGNYIGTDVTGLQQVGQGRGILIEDSSSNIIGGVTNAERNVISSSSHPISISNTSATEVKTANNVIQGNYIGVGADGVTELSSGNIGVEIYNSSETVIGGTTIAARNIITGHGNDGAGVGIAISGMLSANNLIQGNYIGIAVDGTTEIPNDNGIYIDFSDNNVIKNNVIVSNGTNVYSLGGNGNYIQGNKIGVNAEGDLTVIKSQDGIELSGENNTIGGVAISLGNTISGNESTGIILHGKNNLITGNSITNNGGVGVRLFPTNTSNQITSNIITENGSVGIDLVANGNGTIVTPNDPLDTDIGVNNLQNYPVLSSATATNSAITINGTLNSEANKTYRIEFFSNDACDASGYGEGQNYLSFTEVTTNASGDASVSTTLTASGTIGKFITSTATDPDGNTSEFSACTLTFGAIKQAPVLIAPPNGVSLNDDAFTFTWNAVNSATSYQLQIDNQANFSNPFVDATVNETEYDATGLDDEVRLYWRVRAGNVLGFGPWSRTYNFWVDITTPTTPLTLTHPLDGSFTFDTTPAFSWSRPRDAKKYQLVISTNDTCEDAPLFTSAELTRNGLLLPAVNALPAEDTYFWCVRYADAAGNWSDYSQPFNFDLTLLRSPLDSSATTDKTPTLTWNRAPGTGVTYDVLLDTDPLFASPETIADNLSLTRFTPTNDLAPDTYYWRVLVNGGSWNVEDAIIWSFLVTPTRLAAPVITAPNPNAFTNDSTPLIDWTPVSAISGVDITYEVWIDDASSFSSPQKSDTPISDSQYEIDPALPDTPGKRYYLKVRAVYDGVVFGPWSSTRNFTLDTVAPTAKPSLTAPADDSTATSNRPTFTWGAVTGATRYELYLDDGVNPPVMVVYNGSGRSYRPAVGLPAGTYFWQVIAYDAAGNASPASDVRSLTIP